jgi:hypothetical protein
MAKTEDKGAMPPKLAAAVERFDAVYAEWLAARADVAARHEEDTVEDLQRRVEREDAAELALATTPAPHASAVWEKWGFLEHYAASEIERGQSKYSVLTVTLASLRADVSALGLRPWPKD